MKKPQTKPKCDDRKAELRLHADDASIAKLAHGLGHPARVAIVRLLEERRSCLCGEIVEQLPLAQSTVSQHLKALQQAGWIEGEIDGPRVCYCLSPAAVTQFKSLLKPLLEPSHETP